MAATDLQRTIQDLEAAGADPRLAAAVARAVRPRSGPSPVSILAAATAPPAAPGASARRPSPIRSRSGRRGKSGVDRPGAGYSAAPRTKERAARQRDRRGKRRMTRRLIAIVEREGDGFTALCPEVDVASQGQSVAEARDNLAEALALFFEAADTEETDRRLSGEVYVTQVEVAVG